MATRDATASDGQESDLYALSDVEVDEISLVPRAANGRKLLLLKADTSQEQQTTDGAQTMFDDQMKAALGAPANGEDAAMEKLKAAGCSDEQVMMAKGAMRLLGGLSPEMLAAMGLGGAPATQPETETEIEMADQNATPPPDEKLAALKADLEKGFNDKKAAIEKALDEERKKTAAIEKALLAERDLRLTKEAIEKAAAEFPHLGDSKDLGTVLKGLAEKAPDLATKVEEVLKRAEGLVSKSDIFRPIGSRGTGATGSAQSELDQRAKALVEKGDAKTLASARVLIQRQDPSLKERLREETSR